MAGPGLMDFQWDEPKTWLGGIFLALCGFVTWSTGRQVKRWEEQQQDHADRIAELEKHAATRADIEGVYERINQVSDAISKQITDQGVASTAQHSALLAALLLRGH